MNGYRKYFGKTEWSSKWLGKLLQHGDHRRIDRGLDYALNGMVRQLSFSDGELRAWVSGTERYRVRIRFPKFSKNEKEKVIATIRERPMMLIDLSKGKVSRSWTNLCLPMFEKAYIEHDMECDCPDSASPCKHVVAVLMKAAETVDLDPFRLFVWYGLDLQEEFPFVTIDQAAPVESQPMIAIPSMRSLVKTTSEAREITPPLSSFDTSSIPDGGNGVITLLMKGLSAPQVRQFKMEYIQPLESAKLRIRQPKRCEIELERMLYGKEARVWVDGAFGLTLMIEEQGWSCLDWDSFLFAFNEGQLSETTAFCPSMRWVIELAKVARELVLKGMIVPRMMEVEEGRYAVRWMPFSLDPAITALVEEIGRTLPLGIVTLPDGTPVENGSKWLLSALIAAMVHVDSNYRMTTLFFGGTKVGEERIGWMETPHEVDGWLGEVCDFSWEFLPTVLVDEREEGLFVGMDLLMPDGTSIPIRDFLMSEHQAWAERHLRTIASLNRYLKKVVTTGEETRLPLDRLMDFLRATDSLRAMGIKLLLPRSLRDITTPVIKAKASLREKSTGMLEWWKAMDFDVEIALGENCVPVKEFQRLLEKSSSLIYYKERYFQVDTPFVNRLRAFMGRLGRLSVIDDLSSIREGSLDGVSLELSGPLDGLVKEWAESTASLPTGLSGVLRPYQERGFQWLFRNFRNGLGSVIADDMGLGKTIQVISLLLKVKETVGGKFLVVAPVTLLPNWQHEIARFAPSLSVKVFHGHDRSLEDFKEDVLLTSYSLARNELNLLQRYEWTLIAIDEASQIKNAKAQVSRALRSLPARGRVAMSGTPVENKLSELWSILDFVNPGFLGTAKAFQKDYADPIEKSGDKEKAERLKRMIAPFVLRRLKTDRSIIQDLPKKIEQDERAFMVPMQAALYQRVVEESMRVIEGIEENGDQRTAFKRKGAILKMILSLKEICNHPAQFLKDKSTDHEQSGKLMMLMDRVGEITEAGEKVLIFTQFKEMGHIICENISRLTGKKPLFLHGSTTLKERERMVDRFQRNPEEQVFVLTLKAAGYGLNLTEASHVIHYDLWWNPAVEAQGTDRAYRIGQRRNVIVHRFITEGSFEESINRLMGKKRVIAEMTVGEGERWIGNLTNRELRELFG